MKSMANVFGKSERAQPPPLSVTNWPLPDQLIGVEIEAENMPGTVLPADMSPYWTQHRDGSLRSGGMEYVLAMPMRGSNLSEAISMIFAHGKFKRSVTGSTHIHVDMMEKTTTSDVTKALMLMLFAMEPALFTVGDRGREWCGYTNKLASAPDELMGSVLNCTDDDTSMLVRFCQDQYRAGRYYGINILALAKYGSVEFRYFPTATSAEELNSWISLAMCFKKAAQEIGGVAGVCRVFESPDLYETFISQYFGPWREAFMTEVPQWVARSAAHKALAIAATFQLTKRQFNPVAITDNKVMAAKFLKNKKAKPAVTGIKLCRTGERAPSATLPVGTLLIMSSGVYATTSSQWETFPYDDPNIYRQGGAITRALVEFAPTFERQGREHGFNDRTISSLKVRLQQVVDHLSSYNGVIPPALVWTAPVEAAVTVPQPPIDFYTEEYRRIMSQPQPTARVRSSAIEAVANTIWLDDTAAVQPVSLPTTQRRVLPTRWPNDFGASRDSFDQGDEG